jgi:hypothetical protein
LQKEPDDFSLGILRATTGMLAIRTGAIEGGIASYKASISLFKRLGNQAAVASATAYLALEVSRAGAPQANESIKEAEELIKDLRYAPEVGVILERAKRWNAAVQHRQGTPDALSVSSLEPKA